MQYSKPSEVTYVLNLPRKDITSIKSDEVGKTMIVTTSDEKYSNVEIGITLHKRLKDVGVISSNTA